MALPKRLSVFDEGYDPLVYAPLIVTLDGVEQQSVTGYDIEAGTVSRCQRDAAGKLIVHPVTGDVLIEMARGVVEVRSGNAQQAA